MHIIVDPLNRDFSIGTFIRRNFNLNGQKYLAVRHGRKWGTDGVEKIDKIEIHKVNADGSTTPIKGKAYRKSMERHTEAIIKYNYDTNGDKNIISMRETKGNVPKRGFFFASEDGTTLMQGFTNKKGRPIEMCKFNLEIFTNPEMLTNNAKRILKQFIRNLSKAM